VGPNLMTVVLVRKKKQTHIRRRYMKDGLPAKGNQELQTTTEARREAWNGALTGACRWSLALHTHRQSLTLHARRQSTALHRHRQSLALPGRSTVLRLIATPSRTIRHARSALS
jgi:hypothetical protein